MQHRDRSSRERGNSTVPSNAGEPQSSMDRECQASTETGDKHQPETCKDSAEATMSSINRTFTHKRADEGT